MSSFQRHGRHDVLRDGGVAVHPVAYGQSGAQRGCSAAGVLVQPEHSSFRHRRAFDRSGDALWDRACTSPAFVSIYGSIRQGSTSPVTGYWNAWVPCDGVTRWTAPVTSTVVLFKGRAANLFSGGKATVGGSASAFDPETGEYRSVNFTQDVVLRGK